MPQAPHMSLKQITRRKWMFTYVHQVLTVHCQMKSDQSCVFLSFYFVLYFVLFFYVDSSSLCSLARLDLPVKIRWFCTGIKGVWHHAWPEFLYLFQQKLEKQIFFVILPIFRHWQLGQTCRTFKTVWVVLTAGTDVHATVFSLVKTSLWGCLSSYIVSYGTGKTWWGWHKPWAYCQGNFNLGLCRLYGNPWTYFQWELPSSLLLTEQEAHCLPWKALHLSSSLGSPRKSSTQCTSHVDGTSYSLLSCSSGLSCLLGTGPKCSPSSATQILPELSPPSSPRQHEQKHLGAGSMAQLVKYVPSMYKALCSIPSTT